MTEDSHYQFHDTPITDRETGHTFMHRSYCETPAEAIALARLTFTNPAVYAVGDNLSCAPRESQEAQQTELF